MKKEYIYEILCRIGLHRWSDTWKNSSRFLSGWDSYSLRGVGWIARLEKKCKYCDHSKEKTPFLRAERKRLIHEAAEKRNK